MSNNVSVRIKEADLRDRAWREPTLPASLAKHVLGPENGGFLIVPTPTEHSI